jgi:hypothetical protein
VQHKLHVTQGGGVLTHQIFSKVISKKKLHKPETSPIRRGMVPSLTDSLAFLCSAASGLT